MSLINIDLKPDSKTLRVFSTIGLVMFAIIALTLYQWDRIIFIPVAASWSPLLMKIFGGLSVYCAICAATVPKLALPLYVTMTLVFAPIGFVVSHLVMGIIFYLVVTPIGLVFKLIGRDSMTRKFDPQAKTYWIEHQQQTDMKRYFRQF